MAWTAGATVTTGDLITAAQWNSYLGASGSLDYLKDALDDCASSAPSRSLDTVYENTSGKTRVVTVTCEIGNADAVRAMIGSSSPLSTAVANAYNQLGYDKITLSFTFLVPAGWYYEVEDWAGNPVLNDWHEWDLM